MGARKREEGRGLKKEEGAWAMADKDKKKLKVILKLPPKSSSAQLKSNPAAAPVANNAHASALSAFSAPPTTSHKISSSKNAHSRSHGSAAAAAPSPAPAAPASSSGPLFHTSATFSSVRSTSNSSGPSAALPAASSASLHVSSPQPSSRNPTPPKKRKFKSVEHAGALGVGAAGSTATAGAAPASVRDGGGAGGPTSVREGGGAGGTKSVREGGGTGGTTKGGGGRGGGGGGKGEGGGLEVGGGGGLGGRTAGAVPALSPFPVIKKSHKKQVKPSRPTDGPQPHNPFAGVILPPKAPSELLSKAMLEGVLEKLQKKDTYAVFAEPVDADQVPDYYEIIKEPMDFGTMRKKIKKGSYFTLEQFEGDIHLICSNAMRYNGPETIYYKQAKAIRDMARKALEGVGVQLAGELRKPVSHKKKQSPSKKSHSKKPALSKVRLDGTGSDFTSGATLAGDGEHRGWSNSTVDTGKAKKGISMEKLVGLGEDSADTWVAQPPIKESKVDTLEEPTGAVLKPMGPKDGRRPLSTDENHRSSYRQRLLPAHGQGPPLAAVGGESRTLVPVGNQLEHAYALSLARFGAELGPRALHFVEKRLERLNVPIVQEGRLNDSPGGKTTIQSPIQTGLPTDSNLLAVGQSAGVGGGVSSPSGPSFSGQVADATRNHPPGVPHAGQVVGGSTPSFPAGASHPGQSKVSSPKHPSGASQVAESVVSTPNHTSGTSQVGDVLVSTHNHPSGTSQVFPPNFSSGAMSHVTEGIVSAPNYPSVGTSHVGQPSGSTSTYPSDGTSHPGQVVVSAPNYASRTSQVSTPSFPSISSNVGQGVGPSVSSSVASHAGQTLSSNQGGVGIGSTEHRAGKDVQLSSQKVEGPDKQQGPGTGNGRLEDTRSDFLVHTSGTKQSMGLGSDAVSEDKNSLSRLGWTEAGPVTGVEQGVRGLPVGATSKGFPQAWSTSLKQGPTSYAYPPVTSSSGRDEANAQAWAQARVMSLTQPTEISKRNLSTGVQGFQTQSSQLKPTANVSQILQPNVYADYNNLVSRLPPRQSTGMSLSSVPAPQIQGQQAEAFLKKSGAPEQKVSLNLHSQGNMRPSPLQKSSLQQRAMPPDLNVALLSPSASALQSPQPQQGSTPTSSQQPDLKLQL